MTGAQDKTIKLWNPFRPASDPAQAAKGEALLVQTYTGPHGYEIRDVAITQVRISPTHPPTHRTHPSTLSATITKRTTRGLHRWAATGSFFSGTWGRPACSGNSRATHK